MDKKLNLDGLGLETLAVRAGIERSQFGEHSEALYLTSSFVFKSAAQAAERFAEREPGPIYSRFTNPTVTSMEKRLAALEGTEACIGTSSGMAAITAVLRALPGMHDGKKTLQLEFPYVDSLKVQELFGHGVVYLNDATGESFDEALMRIRQGEFAGVFTEVPSNPLLRTIDLHRVAKACEDSGTPFIIDDSAAGPLNVDALRFADVVTGSLTKWISGKGDVMAGMATVRADSPVANALRESLTADSTESAPLYIGDAEVLLSNLKGYSKRMATVNANGQALAAWLANHPAVAEVWHPSLTHKANYEAVMHKGAGYGGLLSFVLKTQKKTPKVYDALRLSKGPSFGTPFTLVCPYTLLAHYHELEWAEGCGVSPNLLRVSCGLEPIETIIAAFEEAFTHA